MADIDKDDVKRPDMPRDLWSAKVSVDAGLAFERTYLTMASDGGEAAKKVREAAIRDYDPDNMAELVVSFLDLSRVAGGREVYFSDPPQVGGKYVRGVYWLKANPGPGFHIVAGTIEEAFRHVRKADHYGHAIDQARQLPGTFVH